MRYAAFAVFICLACLPGIVSAAETAGIPGDADGDRFLTDGELAATILGYLDTAYMGGPSGGADQADVRDAAFVYARWEGRPLTITDATGAVVTLTAPLRRVVVFNAETLETLRSLGFDPERVVAVDKYTLERPEFFPEYQGKENIGSVWSPDYEKVLSVRPDAVFLYATSSSAACDEIHQKLAAMAPGIRVLRFDGFRPETYADEILTLGKITAREKEAEELASFYTSVMGTIEDTVASIPEEERVTVYFENWKEYKTCGMGSGYQDKIERAGGRNIFADEETDYPVVDPEAVIMRNPAVAIKMVGTGGMDFGGYGDHASASFAEVFRGMEDRPGWSTVSAVQNGRIHIIHSDIFGGPQHFIGIAYLATWFYPERFADLDPSAVHQRYISEFQGRTYDITENGIFVYP